MKRECLHINWKEEDYYDPDPQLYVKCLDCGKEFRAWDSKADMESYPKGYDDLEYYVDDDGKKLVKIT